MNAPFAPDKPPEPLAVRGVGRVQDSPQTLEIYFNRKPTDDELRAYSDAPPAPTMLADTQQFASRLMACELVARLLEFYILGSIVLPDTPAAMDWLKSYLKGDGHGPLGKPLRWPVFIPSAVGLLDRWGYEPADGFVAKAQ